VNKNQKQQIVVDFTRTAEDMTAVLSFCPLSGVLYLPFQKIMLVRTEGWG